MDSWLLCYILKYAWRSYYNISLTSKLFKSTTLKEHFWIFAKRDLLKSVLVKSECLESKCYVASTSYLDCIEKLQVQFEVCGHAKYIMPPVSSSSTQPIISFFSAPFFWGLYMTQMVRLQYNCCTLQGIVVNACPLVIVLACVIYRFGRQSGAHVILATIQELTLHLTVPLLRLAWKDPSRVGLLSRYTEGSISST